jgi:hypothetical protein
MSGVRVTQEHLMVYWCQAMAHFELWCVKNWHLDIKSGPKLTLFCGFRPYLLLPDYFISSSYLQWLVLGWPKSIWWPIGVRPWHILSYDMSKIGTLTSNLGQNSHCFKVWHYICCCQTISYHPHISNEWCKGDPRAFDGLLVSGHGTFWAVICQKLAPWHQIWAKTHTFLWLQTISVAARLFHIILISPMTGVRVTQEHLMAYWCQAMANFELWYVSKIGTLTSNLGQNSHCFKLWHYICCCQTISYHPHISNEWC